jgi:tRNA modification GTPase
MFDTIAAISTAPGKGAVSIIRVSGNDAISIVDKIFDKDIKEAKTHTMNYGHIIENDNIIDEVLVMVMRSPKSFTTEDVVEINCHGGISVINKILEITLNKGARLAEPGEFTKRAFLNGRIDLLEAESVMDLINSKTEKARKLAMQGIEGNVSKLIRDLRFDILKTLANIEVNIDYPEYEDILVVTNEMIKENIKEIKEKLIKTLDESEHGRIIKDGINVVILGKPNVGKSSILNKLVGKERAIVTDIPGTTRDMVDASFDLDGILLNIMDTAGIRKTDNLVEEMGVKKSLELIDKADLIILTLNNNEALAEEDLDLIEKTKNKKRILFINKQDLESKLDRKALDIYNPIEGNTTTATGLDVLKSKIKEMFNFEQIEESDLTYLSNARHISILKETISIIKDIEESLEKDMPIDILEIDIKKIWELLGNIIGENQSEELIDCLFSNFCLGK